MSVKIINGIQCPHCDEIILTKDLEKPTDHFQCEGCNEIYETEKEAKLCCKDDVILELYK